MDLKHALHRVWKGDPQKVCIIDEDKRFTVDALVRRAMAVGRLIAMRDRSETGHVGIVLPNSEAFVSAFLGCIAAGRAAVPINFLMAPPEVRFILEHSQSRLVLTVSYFRPLIEAVTAEGAAIDPVYLDELMAALPEEQVRATLAAIDPEALAAAAPEPDRTACLIYTSGTTGVAKGVILSHRNLIANYESMHEALDIHKEDVFLSVLPLFHSFGMTTTMLLPALNGSSIVIMRRFHPATAIDLIEREGVTVLLLVAPMFALIMRMAAREPARLRTVRIAVAGGGPLAPALEKEFRAAIGFPVLQGYGLTEAAPVVSTNLHHANKPDSVGKPLPGVEAEIRDDQGRKLPPGETGDIHVRGGNIMVGYYRNPEATAISLGGDGWLATGDAGYMDEDGYVYVTGRKKEMIIFGGEKIFPQEIEHALAAHPAIAEAAVVGVSDALRVEYPKAFLVLKEGAAFDERELRRYLADRLAAFKVPREFQVAEALPKNALGKVLKHELVK